MCIRDRDKDIVQRRLDLLAEEGNTFKTGVNVGVDVTADQIKSDFDAVVLCVGATQPRDLKIHGRSIEGIHFAMEFLHGSTQHLLSKDGKNINAKGKKVVVIGGGDTGTDCIGTSMRQGCESVVNLEIVTRPPEQRADSNPWPQWPVIFRTDYGHAEAKAKFGKDPRQFSVETIEFMADKDYNLTGLKTVEVDWSKPQKGGAPFSRVDGTERIIEADLIFLALGFLGPEEAISNQFGVKTDGRSNIEANDKDYSTNVSGVFAAGDCRRGQSLVVWAIGEGRGAAEACCEFLSGVAQPA